MDTLKKYSYHQLNVKNKKKTMVVGDSQASVIRRMEVGFEGLEGFLSYTSKKVMGVEKDQEGVHEWKKTADP